MITNILIGIKERLFAFIEESRNLFRAYSDRQLMRSRTHGDVLSDLQKHETLVFWSKYIKKPHFLGHEYYTEKNGLFSPWYIPLDIYYTKVDPFFNDWNMARVIDHKCFYDMYLPNVKQPITIAKKINGFWFDGQGNWITETAAKQILDDVPVAFAKIAANSCGGNGVWCLKTDSEKEKIWKMLEMTGNDMIFQLPIKQHSAINMLYPHSINSIRVISLMRQEGVKIYSMVIRMGCGGSVVDNITSGGMSCGIGEDNRLKCYAYTKDGDRVRYHPDTGTVFDGYLLPAIDQIRAIVKENHKVFPHFRLLSWDFAIDDNSDPVLVEINLSYGALDCHQFNNGPLFGKDTVEILDEVFGINSLDK